MAGSQVCGRLLSSSLVCIFAVEFIAMAVFFTRDDSGFSPKSQKAHSLYSSVGAVLLSLSFERLSVPS